MMIKKQFGVSYHPAHVSRLLRSIKYSVQQPLEQATQRDEEAIAIWKEQRWPELKKVQQESRTIIFVGIEFDNKPVVSAIHRIDNRTHENTPFWKTNAR